MNRWGVVMFASMLALASGVRAQDRRGFISTAAAGVAPVARFSSAGMHDQGVALGLGFSVGYQFGKRDAAVLDVIMSRRRSDYYTDLGRSRTHLDGSPLGNQYVTSAFAGPVWYHYFRPRSPSFFSTLGVGTSHLHADDFGRHDAGYGALVGGGYEIRRAIQLRACLTFGRTTDDGVAYHHLQGIVLLSLSQSL